MKCPNLMEWINWTILICKAGKRPYVPPLTELHEYCKSEHYKKCPYYLKAVKNELVSLQVK